MIAQAIKNNSFEVKEIPPPKKRTNNKIGTMTFLILRKIKNALVIL
jgi:hypothetical protein